MHDCRPSDPGDNRRPFRINSVTWTWGNREKKDEKRPKNPLIDVPREATLFLFDNKRREEEREREREELLVQPGHRGSLIIRMQKGGRPGVVVVSSGGKKEEASKLLLTSEKLIRRGERGRGWWFFSDVGKKKSLILQVIRHADV